MVKPADKVAYTITSTTGAGAPNPSLAPFFQPGLQIYAKLFLPYSKEQIKSARYSRAYL